MGHGDGRGAEHVHQILISGAEGRLRLEELVQAGHDLPIRGFFVQRGVVEHIRGLRGRTLGVIGLGHNGRAVARLACAMGMHVLGLDVRAGLTVDGVEAMYGPQGLHDLLRAADFCVLCVPLTARTRGMIDAAELAALGPKGYLINVARGAVVDERALGRALRRGQIALCIALDNIVEELSNRLVQLDQEREGFLKTLLA